MKINIDYNESAEDCISKFEIILEELGVNYQITDYDNKSSIDFKTPKEILDETEEIQMDIEDDLLIKLMMMAHEQNITLNKLIENILREQIEQENING
jgi:predicted HicB family RNase H-like nuclease